MFTNVDEHCKNITFHQIYFKIHAESPLWIYYLEHYRKSGLQYRPTFQLAQLCRSRDHFFILSCLTFLVPLCAIGSKEVREDPYDVVKILDQCFVIFLYGIGSVFLDISMHHMDLIEIKNKISVHQIERKFKQ